jgi:hypothetical protein
MILDAFSTLSRRALYALAVLAVAGCARGQQAVTSPVSSCPTPGSGVYTTMNLLGSSTPPTTSTSYTVSGVSAPTCYIAQGVINGTPVQTGSWSNTVGPTSGGATGKVNLSVTCTAGAGTTCTGVLWEFSYAAAVTVLAPAVPSMGAPTTSQVVKPALPNTDIIGTLALNAGPR